MSIIAPESLADLRHQPALQGKKIGFCSGSFDLTHAGHALFFEDCKKHVDVLVVGVGGDAIMQAYKGPSRPILNEHLRLKMVDSLKPVDYVFVQIVSNPEDLQNLLVKTLSHTFNTLKPDVYIINEDAFDISIRERLAKQYAVPLIILPRTCPPEFEDVSTRGIIEKIKRLP